MLLHVFCVVWNEEKIILDFIQWYRKRVPGCLITIWDNESNDNTCIIAKENDCEVISFNTGGKMDEKTLIEIRNSCWIDSPAEYIIVCDADEWVDVNKHMLLRNSHSREWNVCKCLGYEMVGNIGDTVSDITRGVLTDGYCKPVLFRKEEIANMKFAPGSHNADPIPNKGYQIKWKFDFPNLYHTKHRSWEDMLERAKLLAQRRSDHSKQMGWNYHYELDESIHSEYRNNLLDNAVTIK